MREVFELHEFFIEGKDSLRSHVLLHISEPAVGDHKKGYFFAICEVNDGSLPQIETLQQMIDDIETAYYDGDIGDEKDPFEATIEFMNRRGADVVAKHGKVNCFLGVARGKELIFTTHGEPYAFVFYRKQGKWKHIDLIPPQEESAEQLFESVTSGRVATGDYIFVATPSVAEHFPLHRLEKLFSTRGTKEVIEHISRSLQGLKSNVSFGGALIYRPFQHETPKTGKAVKRTDKGSQDSLNEFVDKQKSTAETLSPPLLSGASETFSNFFKKKKKRPNRNTKQSPRTETNFRPRTQQKEPTGPMSEKILVMVGKSLFMGLIAVLVVIKKIFLGIYQSGKVLFYLATNYKGERQHMIRRMQDNVRRKKQWFLSLSIVSKALLVIAAGLLIAFGISILTLQHKQEQAAVLQQETELLTAIRDKKDAAEASLIYGDDEKALVLLQEARDLVAELPTNTETQQEQAANLQSDISTVLDDLRKLVQVDTETVTALAVPEGVQLSSMTLIDDTLLVFDKDHDKYYEVNVDSGAVNEKEDEAAKALIAASTPKENDTSVFLRNDNRIASYNPATGGVSATDIGFPNNDVDIVNLFVYNRRLYSLDPINNQIYKHSQTQTGYDQGAAWITDGSASIDNAVSLTIDGDIYVLESDGNIVKFSGGKEEAFTIRGLDPALSSPKHIWTYNDVDEIYILEPTNRRLVVLDKQGRLISQYSSENWQAPQAFVADSESGKVYVLDGNVVYRIAL